MSSALACITESRSTPPPPSATSSATLSLSQASDFLRVRWRPASSTTPVLMSMSGLMDSMLPSRAWAPPILPPFLRFSRVSMAA